MVISALLKGEFITVDNHHENLPFEWDSKQDIHLDKKSKTKYNGKPVAVSVKVSLNTDRGINIVPDKHLSDKNQRRVREKMEQELREAFEDPKNRERVKLFVRDTLHFIVDISGRKDPKEEYVRDAFNRIMRFFGLAEPTGELLVNEANNYFQKYKIGNHFFYIASESNTIEMSEFDKEGKRKYVDKVFHL